MSETETFDYVIVGAGTAGCVLARRLSEDSDKTVCLIEAGPVDRDPLIRIPGGLPRMVFHPTYNYRFNSAGQAHCYDRSVYVPRGRGLGGSSSVNGMVYMRGNRRDYDDWAALGNAGWGWDDLLPYFRKSIFNENYNDGVAHDREGPLHIKFLPAPNPLAEVFLEAARSLQMRPNSDFNDGDTEGVGLFQVTIRDGRRETSASAFLHPVENRPNLKIMTDSPTERIVLEDGRATGVEVKTNGATRRVAARHELILAAGALQTPQILMLSGIGDGNELSKFGIETRHALPGVGANLQEHITVPVRYGSPSSLTYGVSWRVMPKLAWHAARYAVTRTGIFSNNMVECGGFMRSAPDLDRPDLQFVFVPTRGGEAGKMIGWGHGYRLSACLIRPKSRGRVGLTGPTADDAPLIDFNFLSEPSDMEKMVFAVRQARAILEAPAFDRYRGEALSPTDDERSDERLAEVVRRNCSTMFHPVGTCRMGHDDMAVVDDRLRVRGIAGLRIADASIMPIIPGGNTNGPTMAIAEKGADLIKDDARS